MKKLPLALVVATFAASALTACGVGTAPSSVPEGCKPAHQFKTLNEGVLTVATFDLPPFTKVKGTELTGVDGDVLNAIAKKECLTLRAAGMAASAVIPSVQAGRADVAAGDWYRTEARAQIVALSDPV